MLRQYAPRVVDSVLGRGYHKVETGSDGDDGELEQFIESNDEKLPHSTATLVVHQPSTDKVTRILWLASSVAFLVATLSLSVLGLSQASAAIASTAQLRRPNPYMGLDRVVRNNSWPLPLLIPNYPLFIAQVDSQQPDRVGEPRHVLVTEHVSTIAQFRTRDFNMGNCTVGAWLPPYSMLEGKNKTYLVSNGATQVEIWRLDADELDELNPRYLNWNTRPKRKSLHAVLDVTTGRPTHVEYFPCETRKIFTYEFACTLPGCRVEMRQDESSPRMAFMMFQYPERALWLNNVESQW